MPFVTVCYEVRSFISFNNRSSVFSHLKTEKNFQISTLEERISGAGKSPQPPVSTCWLIVLFLFEYFPQRDYKCFSNSFAISRISFQTVTDVSNLDLFGSIAHSTGSVGKEDFLLLSAHQSEEFAGLGVVIIVLPMVPVISCSFQAQRRFGGFRLLLPLPITVGLVAESAAIIAVNPHGPVTVVTVNWTTRGINWDQVMIYTEPVALGISVGK
jgi:hypothetical protein